MPTQKTIVKARRKEREGKKPSTQAGEFVKEEMHRFEHGDPGIKSRKQAIAIGLSEARRAGVKLPPPKKGETTAATRKKAANDTALGAHNGLNASPPRSSGGRKAVATRKRKSKTD